MSNMCTPKSKICFYENSAKLPVHKCQKFVIMYRKICIDLPRSLYKNKNNYMRPKKFHNGPAINIRVAHG